MSTVAAFSSFFTRLLGATRYRTKAKKWSIFGFITFRKRLLFRVTLASGNFYVLWKRMHAISLYRYDVSIAVVWGKLRCLSGRPRDLWQCIFRHSFAF